MTLNATELLVIATKTQRLSEVEALEYLKSHGVEMSRDTYYRTLGRVSSQSKKRLFEICKNMNERYVERIDDVEFIRKELLEILKNPKSSTMERLRALHELRELQPWMTSFDEGAQGVLEDAAKQFGDEEHVDVSEFFKEKK